MKLYSVVMDLMIFDTTGSESTIKALTVAYATRLAGRCLLEQEIFSHQLHPRDFIESVPECSPPEPILGVVIKPLLLEIYREDLYVRRRKSFSHLGCDAAHVCP